MFVVFLFNPKMGLACKYTNTTRLSPLLRGIVQKRENRPIIFERCITCLLLHVHCENLHNLQVSMTTKCKLGMNQIDLNVNTRLNRLLFIIRWEEEMHSCLNIYIFKKSSVSFGLFFVGDLTDEYNLGLSYITDSSDRRPDKQKQTH